MTSTGTSWRGRENGAVAAGIAAALTATALLAACVGQGSAGRDGPLAIHDVTVIPATGEGPVPNATVVVEAGRIAAVGPAGEVTVPDGARTVDGTGRYLLPGLIDMHVHLSKTRGSSLALFVANGVTTVRDMGGELEELRAWEREIRSGERAGPRILAAGPYLESTANVDRMRELPPKEMVEPVERTRVPVGSPERARDVVDSLAALGVDHIKIRTLEDRATYMALNRAAEAHDLPLVGHAFGLPPELVAEAGQDAVEHFFYPTLDSLSRADRTAVWERLAEAGVAVVPTLVTFTRATFPSQDSLRAVVEDTAGVVDPRRRHLSRYLLLDWREQLEESAEDRRPLFRRIWRSTLRNLREMREAGVRILPGTDAAVVNVFPGSALRDELALFVRELGMSPHEALIQATRHSAVFLGIADSVGTVAPGMVADLVLLEENPMDDIDALGSIAAVVVRGCLHDADDLSALRAAVDTARDQRVNDWPRSRGPE